MGLKVLRATIMNSFMIIDYQGNGFNVYGTSEDPKFSVEEIQLLFEVSTSSTDLRIYRSNWMTGPFLEDNIIVINMSGIKKLFQKGGYYVEIFANWFHSNVIHRIASFKKQQIINEGPHNNYSRDYEHRDTENARLREELEFARATIASLENRIKVLENRAPIVVTNVVNGMRINTTVTFDK